LPVELTRNIAEKYWVLIIEEGGMTGYKIVLIAIDLEGEPKQVLAKAQLLVDPSADITIFNATFDPSYIYASYA